MVSAVGAGRGNGYGSNSGYRSGFGIGNGLGNGNGSGGRSGHNNGLANPKVAKVNNVPAWGSDMRPIIEPPKSGLQCFLCKGTHRVAECPQRSSLAAVRKTQEDSGQASECVDDKEEDQARLGSFRFLYALHSEQSKVGTERTVETYSGNI